MAETLTQARRRIEVLIEMWRQEALTADVEEHSPNYSDYIRGMMHGKSSSHTVCADELNEVLALLATPEGTPLVLPNGCCPKPEHPLDGPGLRRVPPQETGR